MTYIIKYNRKDCMGCGACTMCDNWEFGNDGKVDPINTEIEELGCNEEAAEICPAEVIKIIKK